MTSDEFFDHWKKEGFPTFDVIFIDGLHLAEQVSRDISMALHMASKNGIILIHDCNPPNLNYAREDYNAINAAGGAWNGTTHKAAWEYAFVGNYEMKVVDCDWGIGVIDKSKAKKSLENPNPYFEWRRFEEIRETSGILITPEAFDVWLQSPAVSRPS